MMISRMFPLSLSNIDVKFSQWRGVVAPAGVPEPIVRKLENIFRQVAADPVFQGRMKSLNVNVAFTDSKAYTAEIAADDKTYERLLKEGKIGNRYK